MSLTRQNVSMLPSNTPDTMSIYTPSESSTNTTIAPKAPRYTTCHTIEAYNGIWNNDWDESKKVESWTSRYISVSKFQIYREPNFDSASTANSIRGVLTSMRPEARTFLMEYMDRVAARERVNLAISWLEFTKRETETLHIPEVITVEFGKSQ